MIIMNGVHTTMSKIIMISNIVDKTGMIAINKNFRLVIGLESNDVMIILLEIAFKNVKWNYPLS